MPRGSRVAGALLLASVAGGCSDDTSSVVRVGLSIIEVVVSPSAPPSLVPGESVEFTAEVRGSGGVERVSVTWSSSAPDVVSIDEQGRAVALAPGTAVVRAAAGSFVDEAEVIVVDHRISEGVVVVDPSESPMVSTDGERTDGILRFVPGTGAVPSVQPGDVLVGSEDGGFLARVLSTSMEGDTLVVVTEPASLTDVVDYGVLDISIPFDGPEGVAPAGDFSWGPTRVDHRAEGVASATEGEIRLDDLKLCDLLKDAGSSGCPLGAEVSITDGRIHFSPTLSFDAEIDGFDLDELKVEGKGTLTFEVTLEASVSEELELEGEQEILRRTKTFAGSIGFLPVVGVARLSFFVGAKGDVSASASASAGYTTSTHISLGVEYDASDTDPWKALGSAGASLNGGPATWGGEGKASIRLWVRPELEVLLYTVAGPSISLTPYIEAAGEIVLNSADPELSTCMYSVKGAIDATLKGRVTFLDPDVGEFTHPMPGTPSTLVDETCTFGTVKVETHTQGDDLDPNGYRVWLDVRSEFIGVEDEVEFAVVPSGEQTVLLTRIAPNCLVSGSNPKTINVLPFEETVVPFVVNCTSSSGTLEVSVSTTGEATPEGYTLVLDGGSDSRAIDPDAVTTFEGLAAGNHSILLDGVPGHCTVEDGASRAFSVLEGQTEHVDFDVECTGGGLSVSVLTTGGNLDDDGYEIRVGDGPPKSVASAGTVEFPDVPPGEHLVHVDGIADNCALKGDNPATVVVSGPGTTSVNLEVECVEGTIEPGTIIITTQAEADALDLLIEVGGGLHISGYAGNPDPVTDLSQLRNLLRVGTLAISGTHLTDLSDLRSLQAAHQLLIQGNPHLTSLDGLEQLRTVAARLGISRNVVLRDISALRNITTTGWEQDGVQRYPHVMVTGGFNDQAQDALTSLEALQFLTRAEWVAIEGMAGLTSLAGLENLTRVERLEVHRTFGLTSLAGLDRLEQVDGGLEITDNRAMLTTSGLASLTNVGGIYIQKNAALQQIVGLTTLLGVGGITIDDNPSLTTIAGLALGTSEADVTIRGNPHLLDLAGLEAARIGKNLRITDNDRLQTLGFGVAEVGRRVEILRNGSVSPMEDLRGLGPVKADYVEIEENCLNSLTGMAGLTVTNDLDIRYNRGISNEDANTAVENVSVGGFLNIIGNTGAICGGG